KNKQIMDEADVRRIVREELDLRDAKERQAIIDSDEFKVLKGDIASAFEIISTHQFPWEDPFVSSEIEERLCRLIKRGVHKDHPLWLRERAMLMEIAKINSVGS
ncbi:MAG TPA: hypothetical protein VIM65_14780, partial [Cyclobacteriaceae bacterium]